MDLHVLERATAAAREHGLWVPLVGLASRMDQPGRRRVAGLIRAFDEPTLESLHDTLRTENLWSEAQGLGLVRVASAG